MLATLNAFPLRLPRRPSQRAVEGLRTATEAESRPSKYRAEADNEVVSVGQIGKKGIYLLLGYRHKAYNCEATHLRSYSKDESTKAQQAERIPYTQRAVEGIRTAKPSSTRLRSRHRRLAISRGDNPVVKFVMPYIFCFIMRQHLCCFFCFEITIVNSFT